MKFGSTGKTRVLIAGALAVPVILGTVSLANASSSSGPDKPLGSSVVQGSTQLTEEGQKMLDGDAAKSGTVVADADGKVVVDGVTVQESNG